MTKQKKEIKSKLVKFSPSEWDKVEQKAFMLNMKTGTYIQRMAINGKIVRLESKDTRDVIIAMNRIGNSINQLARKANETSNQYAADYANLKKEHDELCLILNQYVSNLRLTEV